MIRFVIRVLLILSLTACGTTKEDLLPTGSVVSNKRPMGKPMGVPKGAHDIRPTIVPAPVQFRLQLRQIRFYNRVTTSGRMLVKTPDVEERVAYQIRGNVLARIPGFPRQVQLPGRLARLAASGRHARLVVHCRLQAGTALFPSPLYTCTY